MPKLLKFNIESVPTQGTCVSCRLALAQAEGHPLIKEQLGVPLTAGPWYNSSVDLTHAGHIASCKFTVSGQTSASDVLVRVRIPHKAVSCYPCVLPLPVNFQSSYAAMLLECALV